MRSQLLSFASHATRVLRGFVFATAIVFPSLLAPGAALALSGTIIGAGMSRMPIAVPELKHVGGPPSSAAAEFVRILSADLELSGLFRVLDPASYAYDAQAGGTRLDEIYFDHWLTLGARGLLRGTIETTPQGFTLEARLFDVPGRAVLGARRFAGAPKDIVRVAHRAADVIMELITGERGPFDSQIAFVSDKKSHFRDIHVYGFEGTVRQITQHDSVTMTPAWSPDLQSLIFTSFKGGRPRLYQRRISSGEEALLASKLGLNVGGEWSPNGDLVVLARETAGNTDLYALDFKNNLQWRMTEHWGIDVGASWSPDGRRIAFCSARGGAPQIYVMDVVARTAEQGVRRLSFQGNYNCSPAWSPNGRYIAYAGRTAGRFQIFVMPAEGGPAQQLTFRGSNEDPTWSPDSRYIAFSSDRDVRKKIFMVDLTGRWERQLTTGSGDDTSPSWSRRRD